MSVAKTLWNCRVPMRDGVEIAANVILPVGEGPFPAVVTRTPYMRKPGVWARLVEQGYAYVTVDVRGRGDSDGEFTPFVHDAEDGHDTVEWVASQDWCDSKVGMVGISYEGLTQWWAAKAHPPHLRCIAPMAIGVASLGPRPSFNTGVPHLYWNWWFHGVSGRTQQHGGAPSWEANIGHLPLRTLDKQVGTAKKWWPQYVEGKIDYLGDDFVLTDDDWDALDLPVLIGVGWWDDQTTMNTWEKLRHSPASDRAELLIGAWDHGGNKSPHPILGGLDVSASVIDPVAHVERFLAKHLKGEASGQSASRCRVFRTGSMQWENLDDWPTTRTDPHSWHLDSSGDARTLSGDGTLGDQPATHGTDSYVFDPHAPARDFTNLDLFSWSDPPLDQRYLLRRPDVLVYTSTVLNHPVDVSGQAEFEGYVSITTPDADLSVLLVDVYPDGRRMLVGGELGATGLLRLSLRDGKDPQFLEPSEVVKVHIPLVWMHHRFLKGHRIAIAIQSSAYPAFARNLNTGEPWPDAVDARSAEVTLHHGPKHPSRLVMPIEIVESST